MPWSAPTDPAELWPIRDGTHALGFSPRDLWDRLRVAKALGQLPGVAEALRKGQVSWSKGREIIRVAIPETQREWIERAGSAPADRRPPLS